MSLRSPLVLLFTIAACTSAAPPAPVVTPPPPPVATPVEAPQPPSYQIVKERDKPFGRLVATSASGTELFSREEIRAYTATNESLFVISKLEKSDTPFTLERLDGKGNTVWKKTVPIKGSAYSSVSITAAAGYVVLTVDRSNDGVVVWSVDGETGTPEAAETTLPGHQLRFVDERAVIWTSTRDRVVRHHPNGRPLSSVRVSVLSADAARTVSVVSLFAREAGGAFASTTEGLLVTLDADGGLVSRGRLPEPALEVVGNDAARLLRTRTHLVQLDAQGKSVWDWRAPSGEILDANKRKGGGYEARLSIGASVVLDEAGKVIDASTTAAWGDSKAGLPVDLELAKARHGQVGWRFDRVGSGASAQVQLAGGSGGTYRLPQLGSVDRLKDGALALETVRLTHGTKKPTKYPRGAMSGKDLYVLAATYQPGEYDSYLLGADVYKLQDKRLVMQPGMSFQFEPRSSMEHTAIAADADAVVACAAGGIPSTCHIKTTAGIAKVEVDRIVESVAVHSGAVYFLVAAYQKETELRVLKNGVWTDLGLRTRAHGGKLGVVSSEDIYVLAGSESEQSVFHYDGKGWSALPLPMGRVADLHVRAHDDVWLTGPEGVARWDGKGWTLVDGPVSELSAIVEGPKGTVVLQGPSGTWLGRPIEDKVVARDVTVHASWFESAVVEPSQLEASKSNLKLVKVSIAVKGDEAKAKTKPEDLGLSKVRAVATSPTGEVWAALLPSLDHRAVVLHSFKDGVYRHYPEVPDWTFTNIAVRNDRDVWLVGGMPDTNTVTFDTVVTDWPVGEGGLVHFDGKQFTTARVSVGSLVVVAATGDNEAWAGGAGGTLVHARPSGVEVFSPATAAGTIRTILTDAPGSVWFAGDDRRVMHWDGKAFSTVDAPELPRNTSFTTAFMYENKVHLSGPSGVYRLD